MDHREEYKGAMNSLTETSMPAPQRANMQGLVDSLTAQLTDALARGRHIAPAEARKLVAGGPYGGEAANYALKQNAQKYYSAGQTPPIGLLNPLAWAQFIQAWKRGDFKRSR